MKFLEEPKQRVLDEELERRAVEFHGHGGPFMTVGLRMGLTPSSAWIVGGGST